MAESDFDTLASLETRTAPQELLLELGTILKRIGKFELWEQYREETDSCYTEQEKVSHLQILVQDAHTAEKVHTLSPEEGKAFEKRITELKNRVKMLLPTASYHWREILELEEYELDKEKFWKYELKERQKKNLPYALNNLVENLFRV